MSRRFSFGLTFLLVFTGCGISETGDFSQTKETSLTQLAPLHSWWSSGRADNFTTTDPRWRGAPGVNQPPDYRWYRIEGSVFPPDQPQPLDTVPLYEWYSPERGDNYLTSDPRWAGAPGDSRLPDYRLVRTDGFLFQRPLAGLVPLQSFWDSQRGDNQVSTSPFMTGAISEGTRRQTYTLYRTEGYVYPNDVPEDSLLTNFQFATQAVEGTTPLIGVLIEFSDYRLRSPHTATYYNNLFASSASTNLTSYFQTNSGGKFRFINPQILGPLRFPDNPRTSVDESRLNCASDRRIDITGDGVADQLCPGTTSNFDATVMSLIQSQPGFDFARFDRNRNGIISKDELSIIVIVAEPAAPSATFPSVFPTGAQTRDLVATPSGASVRLDLPVVFAGEGVGFATLAHETTHMRAKTIDLYGPTINGGNGLNSGVSIMSGTISSREDLVSSWHLDPFHKLRAGWVKPRLIGASAEMPAGSATLFHPEDSRYQPIIMFDRRRGSREFYLLEFRNKDAVGTRYDTNSLPAGLAIWYVRLDGNGDIFEMPAIIRPGPNGVIDSRITRDDLVLTDSVTRQPYVSVGPNDWLDTSLAGDDTLGTNGSVYYVGAPGQTRGKGRLWREGDGEIALRWPGSTDSGIKIKVGPVAANASNIAVEWRFFENKFIPRLDRLMSGSRVARGSQVVLEGDFGLNDSNKSIRMQRAGAAFNELPFQTWSPARVSVTIPAATSVGQYNLQVQALPGGMSNGIIIDVE